MRNLHPGANLHPGCKFGHVNGVLRICTRVQICSYYRGGANLFAPGANLHPGANCAHERKPYIFIYFDWRFAGIFYYDAVYVNSIKNNFKLSFTTIMLNLLPGANLHPGANCAHERAFSNWS